MNFSLSNKKAKKTPFQRQKELDEERKRKDDEAAAKVYEEFVKDFGDDDDHQPKFVQGGVIEPGKAAPTSQPSSKKRHYVPSFTPLGMDSEEQGEDEEPVSKLPTTNRGKLRSIDLLLQDLKKDQAEREQHRKEQGPTVEDDELARAAAFTDPGSTNLFVNNLAPDVDESTLMHEFGRFGPIGSVKVMWPRDEEQRRRGRNTGFVAFMKREDAEKAREALDGAVLRDMPIALGWGKSVPLPSVPIWPPPEGLAAAREVGAPLQAPDAAWTSGVRGRQATDVPLAPPKREEIVGRGPDIIISVPEDDRQRFIIDGVAYYVLRDGCDFEQVIMETEHENPEFAFLFDTSCSDHAYYRWRLYSLASGDTLRSWRVEPFIMVDQSNRWFPPPMTATTQQHKGDNIPLTEWQRDKFQDMLQSLTVERQDICNAMVFALDNADSAGFISELLVNSLLLPDSTIPQKIARLFLLSDLLHNTSAPVRSASKYRAKLQDALPDVFEHLQQTSRSLESRMSQELIRRHVLKILRVWRGWYIFSDDFLNGLQATFINFSGPGGVAISIDKTSSELAEQLNKLTDEELQVKCRHNGLSRQGGRELQTTKLLMLDAYTNGGLKASGLLQEDGSNEKTHKKMRL